MKQNQNRIIRLAAAAALLLTAGCSKEPDLSVAGAAYSDVLILPISELVTDPAEVTTQSETRAAADPTKEMTFHLVRADETGTGTGVYDAYATTPLPAVRAAGSGATTLTFDTPQYYFASNAKSKLTGWYPAATSTAGSVVSWTIDGKMDILTAAEKVGNMSFRMPNLVFNHRLAQVQIHAFAPDANAQATWGTISKIEIVEQTNTCTYDFSANATTGTLTPKSGTTGTFSVDNIAAATIPVATAAQVGDPVMIVPQTAAAILKLEVTTSKCGKVAVSMPAEVYAEGKAYILKLKFNAFAIDATASIGQWITVDRSEQEQTPPALATIGEIIDGGVVYWVDPTDATKYKVISVDEAPTTLKWAANTGYAINSGAQSDTDGKGNTDAIKNAFDNKLAGIAITEATFDEAFPAAAYCYNYQGKEGTDAKGTWYLPAMNDLQYLWCAFNGKNPSSWLTGLPSASEDLAAQAVFNKYLTDAGGVNLSSGGFVSSTENRNDYNLLWYVEFPSGGTTKSTKDLQSNVRCSKNVTPPPAEIGKFKNGGIVYWIDPADKAKYKVFSLKQGAALTWAAKTTYAVGADAQDVANGQKNQAAIKAYSQSHTADADDKTKTTGVFDTDFPAAGFCEGLNTNGDTGWYLPAKDEMQALNFAYLANKSVIDAALTANGGDDLSTQATTLFWSNTEDTDPTTAWRIFFKDGTTYANPKSRLDHHVRCIKDLTPPVIGEYKDGGIIYEVTDATHYKVFSLIEGLNLTWSASTNYIIGAKGQDKTDGSKNITVIKTYFNTHTPTVGTDFSVAFPAAAYCDAMNTGGVTGWYLPAIDELSALYRAYMTNKTVLDAAITANSGAAMSISGRFWASGEYNNFNNSGWSANFANGNTSGYVKDLPSSVRCIKTK